MNVWRTTTLHDCSPVILEYNGTTLLPERQVVHCCFIVSSKMSPLVIIADLNFSDVTLADCPLRTVVPPLYPASRPTNGRRHHIGHVQVTCEADSGVLCVAPCHQVLVGVTGLAHCEYKSCVVEAASHYSLPGVSEIERVRELVTD